MEQIVPPMCVRTRFQLVLYDTSSNSGMRTALVCALFASADAFKVALLGFEEACERIVAVLAAVPLRW